MRVGGEGKKYMAWLKSFILSVSPGHSLSFWQCLREEKILSPTLGGQEVFRKCWGGNEVGQNSEVRGDFCPGPPKLLTPPCRSWLFQSFARDAAPRGQVPQPECGCTVLGSDSGTLPSTCPAPRKSRPRPRAPQPRQPRRRAPLLPYLARLCCAGQRGRGPAGRAGRARARAPSPWLEPPAAGRPGPVSQPREGGSRPGPRAPEGGGEGAPRRGRAGGCGRGARTAAPSAGGSRCCRLLPARRRGEPGVEREEAAGARRQ